MSTRGIRNNNPMNIRISTNKWEGKVTPNTDGSFEQFNTPEDGIRAGAKLLLTYHTHYGSKSVADLINRFAPQGDNNPTREYALFVAKEAGVTVNQDIDLDNYPVMLGVITGIIKFENKGEMPYSESTFRDALKRAGVAETPNKPILQESTVAVPMVTGAVGIVGAVSTIANAVSPFSDLLTGLAAHAPWFVAGVILLGLGYVLITKIISIKQGKE